MCGVPGGSCGVETKLWPVPDLPGKAPKKSVAMRASTSGSGTFGGKPWETVATAGFEQMRARGISRPLMDEIEALFAAAK